MKKCNILKELRETNLVRQADLAKFLEITQSMYSQYEEGKIELPADMLVKLAKFYNVNIDYLLGKTEVQEPYPKRT